MKKNRFAECLGGGVLTVMIFYLKKLLLQEIFLALGVSFKKEK